MIMATFETPSYYFEAFAESEKRAIELLREAWKEHADKSGAQFSYIDQYSGDIVVREIKLNTVYRDGEEFLS